MLRKFFLLSIVPCVVVFGLLEISLRTIGFHYKPRQKLLSKPTSAGFTRTVEEYFQTVFDPPGYTWVRADRVTGEAPDGQRTYSWPIAKPPGVKRVAFLGGSTSEPSGPRSYPTRCIDLLNAVAGSPAYELLNVACSSYSSHQSLIALRRYVFPRGPDVVVAYHGWNDTFLSPSEDGYSDKEKDFLVTRERVQETSVPRWAAVGKLRITQLVGRVLDACDRTWPRPRVSEKDLHDNLRAMADECKELASSFVLVYRPRADTPPLYMDNLRENVIKEYRKYGTTKEQLYTGIHDMVLGAQRRVAQESDNVRVADANAYFDSVPEVKGPITDPTAICLFVKDALHNTEIGKQRLAEVVAKSVAPERADQIEKYIHTVEYWKKLSVEFNDMLYPFEAEYAAKQALAIDPSRAPEIQPLLDAANGQKEFFLLFFRGRWWGDKDEYSTEQKINMLSRCLDLKPDDYGVAVQIFRVGLYTGQPGLAAPALDGFHSSNPQIQYEVLRMQFQSYAQVDNGALLNRWRGASRPSRRTTVTFRAFCNRLKRSASAAV